MQSDLVLAALGLGSNMGDTKAHIDAAIAALAAHDGIEVIERSSDYRTPPWGPVPQDDYRNCCLTIKTHLAPKRLLQACLDIELELGRVRHERWGPRTIDIDVLLYGQARVEDDGLSIPHPRMAERAFVLVPLAEIWPTAVIDGGVTVLSALENCPDKGGISKL
ncbi:2-amino-4-hydroxy-6-hydroxymethyldihydropteridine diphosphokinase [Pseudovibrio exalbescens]|uniref:2-amino-4-hydroxy-6-hydroxymethyldihydropteridine pyrophosphokinase n=1 Tax=Pseudovibrio exalbescens TaxID=197461 RepID=A0A1U7JJJ7_9HYPH|nr:2-amino-4-hydroxy-6-hydroxymethyldihydropteridine diphosphokinase [Pseudovibrio exalbescens]OKL44875.1 2-amino-4-hydroxy-6-hydroxymethyldihydropteridine pyrophosphokinase [Pseudovibrio exalbescens]